jgi:Zinc-binding domain of primase-helicase.
MWGVKYVHVQCPVCGWRDGLREDLVNRGDFELFCDFCEDWVVAVLPRPEPLEGQEKLLR